MASWSKAAWSAALLHLPALLCETRSQAAVLGERVHTAPFQLNPDDCNAGQK